MIKVVVGMSGGVDSSVAAYLLKEQGYQVIGVTVQTWDEQGLFGQEDAGCGGTSAVEDATQVAQMLNIPYYVVNFHEEFRRHVIDYFVSSYQRGYTPNPCIACNRYVKWESLLRQADEIGADCIATGHYARIAQLPNGRYSVCNSATAAKDQTYALYRLTQEQLSRTLMPVGEYSKEDIRRIAQEAGLPVASKRDSQDICFVPDHDYASFIARNTGQADIPGNFINEEGEILGRHRGIIHYTIGQRKGLGITADSPLFVKELRTDTNEVVLCRSESLFSNTCYVEDVNYMVLPTLEGEKKVVGKVRYSHKGAACTIIPEKNGIVKCVFDEPQRALTPGQAAVFYEGEHILCGGMIRSGAESTNPYSDF